MNGCHECKALERIYDHFIRRIYGVVHGRFSSVDEKIRELHRLQDLRDEAIETLYAHKKCHSPSALSSKQDRQVA